VVVIFLLGIVIGVLLAFGVLVYLASRIDTEQNLNNAVELHAVRRRRELDQFKHQTKTDARRLRHELRQELRSIDQHRR
jgi:hypothetical protein